MLHFVINAGRNADMVRRLGADEVVDYTQGPFGDQLAGKEPFDVVFDFLGGADTERSAAGLLRRGGHFVTAVGPVAVGRAVGRSVCRYVGL